jgi:TonB family protein
MFEDLAQTLTPQAVRSRRLALPIAITVHLALAAVLLLQAVYGPDTLKPPDLMSGSLWSQPPQVTPPPGRAAVHKVVLVKKSDVEEPSEIKLPSDVPDTIPVGKGTPAVASGRDFAGDDFPVIPGMIDTGTGRGGPGPILKPGKRVILNGYDITPPRLLKRVEPAYPPAAAAMGLTGRVVLQLVVNEKGRVESADVVQSSSPIFDAPALAAVRQWVFTRPVDRDGQIVACYMTVVVRFALR